MKWSTILIAALLGSFVSAVTDTPGLGLLVLAVGVGLALKQAHGRIELLQARLEALEQRDLSRQTTAPRDATAAAAGRPGAPSPAPQQQPQPQSLGGRLAHPPMNAGGTGATASSVEPAFLDAPGDAAVHAVPDDGENAPSVTSSLGQSLLAWFRGGNTIVRAGAVILFIGVAFLLRFAAEHALLPLEWRLAGVAAGGAGLVALGWRLRGRRHGYALSLQGAGIGVLYLVIFAALRLYALVPPPLAFVLLVVLSAATALLAVAQQALALAVLGFGGGFLAPVLASTGSGSHVVLFSYYGVLNLAIAWIASRQAWKLLNLVGFAFTFVIGAAWGWRSYEPSLYLSTQAFLAAHFALYLFIGVQYSRQLVRARDDGRLRLVDGGLLFGLPIVAFGLQAGLVRHLPYGLALSSAVLSGVYLLLGRWLWRHAGASLRLLTEGLLALGLVFLVLVTPLALDARWTGAAWAVQGAGVVWIALRQGRGWATAVGLLLQVLAAIAFWLIAPPAPGPWLLNAHLLGALLLGGSALVSAWWLRHAAQATLPPWPGGPPIGADWLRALHALMLGLGVLQAWAGLGAELRAADLPSLDAAARACLLSVGMAVLIELVQRRLRWPELGVAGRVLALFALLVSLNEVLFDADDARVTFDRFVLRFGWLESAAVLLSGLWLQRRLHHDGTAWRRSLAAEHLLLGAYAVVHGALQPYAAAAVGIGHHTAWTALAPLVLPVALAFAIAARLARPAWPMAAHPRAWQQGGLWPLLGAMALWSLAVNLLSDGSMAPLPTLPLLNPVDLGHVALLLLALRLRQQGLVPRAWLALGGAVLGFVWLNALLVRTLHHAAGTPMWIDGALDSGLVQTGLTILWTLLALLTMLVATRRAAAPVARRVWMAGAALLALAVLKLFFVDLSNVGTLERIVSFLGVGLLMLVIGYVSPMPPAPARSVSADPAPEAP